MSHEGPHRDCLGQDEWLRAAGLGDTLPGWPRGRHILVVADPIPGELRAGELLDVTLALGEYWRALPDSDGDEPGASTLADEGLRRFEHGIRNYLESWCRCNYREDSYLRAIAEQWPQYELLIGWSEDGAEWAAAVLGPRSEHAPIGFSSVRTAIVYGTLRDVERLLAQDPALMGEDSESSLLCEALQSHAPHAALPLVRLLLAHGADVNGRARFGGDTPLHQIVAYGRGPDETVHRRAHEIELVRVLLDAGADDRASNDLGTIPGDSAAALGYSHVVGMLHTTYEGLRRAVENGKTDVVSALIGKWPGELDQGDVTALHKAAINGRLAIVQMLVEAGADPRRKTAAGQDAADFARKNNHPDVVQYLSGR